MSRGIYSQRVHCRSYDLIVSTACGLLISRSNKPFEPERPEGWKLCIKTSRLVNLINYSIGVDFDRTLLQCRGTMIYIFIVICLPRVQTVPENYAAGVPLL